MCPLTRYYEPGAAGRSWAAVAVDSQAPKLGYLRRHEPARMLPPGVVAATAGGAGGRADMAVASSFPGSASY